MVGGPFCGHIHTDRLQREVYQARSLCFWLSCNSRAPGPYLKTSSNCPAEFLSCLKKQSSNFGGAAPSYGSEFSPRRSVLV